MLNLEFFRRVPFPFSLRPSSLLIEPKNEIKPQMMAAWLQSAITVLVSIKVYFFGGVLQSDH